MRASFLYYIKLFKLLMFKLLMFKQFIILFNPICLIIMKLNLLLTLVSHGGNIIDIGGKQYANNNK